MDACTPSSPYFVCIGSANIGTVAVDASNLTPGKTYLFWLDGYSGSICTYYIYVSGDFNLFKVPDILDVHIPQIKTQECNPSGVYDIIFDLDRHEQFSRENVSANWEVKRPDGKVEKFTTFTNTFDTLSYNFTQSGNYEICVSTYTLCSFSSDVFCKQFQIVVQENDAPIDIQKMDFCISEDPLVIQVSSAQTGNLLPNVSWSGVGIDSLGLFDPSVAGIGTHQLSFQVSIDACLYADTITIVVRDATVGDVCDDDDPETINDVIQTDCTCKGEKVSGTIETSDIGFTIVPNPTSQHILIKSNTHNAATISIYDVNGKVVLSFDDVVLNHTLLDITDLARGIYFVTLRTINVTSTQKMVKMD